MVGLQVQIAISWWFSSRAARGANPRVVTLIPLLFKTIDALYLETRKLPLAAISGARIRREDRSDLFIFGLWLNDTDYVTLRSILGLAGDLREVLESLKRVPNQLELSQFITPLYKEAQKFGDARDFFTHMDEALRDHSKHGIHGPITLGCGIEFTSNVRNSVYLIWDKNRIYFSFERKAKEVVIDKPEFDNVFVLARQLYAEIINNPVSQLNSNTMKPDEVYPL
jgi:hypothetical protein